MNKSKLLRDKRGHTEGPEHERYVARGGEPYRTVVVPDDVLNLLLVGKVHEEIEEVREHMTDVSEYADVLTALLALAVRNGVSFGDIIQEMERKKLQSGDFTLPRILVKD